MMRNSVGCVLVAAAVAACQPMYGAAPEKLAKPKIPVDPTLVRDGEEPPKKAELVEVCQVDISRPRKVVRDKPTAAKRVQEGDAQWQRSQKVTDEQAKATLAKQSLESYSEALVADPFDADATLMLAVSYDSFRRKGCALRMLERIGRMVDNPTFEVDAKAAAARVRVNPHWFVDYRDQAMKAVTP